MFMDSIKPQVYFKFNSRLLLNLVDSIENQPMDHVGYKIKAAIKDKGITQMALAEAVGVSNNAVTKWIKTGKVSKTNIPKVIQCLGMSMSDFFDSENDDLAHALLILRDPKLRALFFTAEKLSENKKSALVQTSIALAEPDEHKQNGTQ